MKKILIALFTMSLCTFVFSTNSTAQFVGDNAVNNSDFTASVKASKPDVKGPAKMNKAINKAYENFSERFGYMPDVTWFTTDGMIAATFTREDKKTDVLFDKRGHWLRTICEYSADKLGRDILFDINYNGYGAYKISMAQEIRNPDMLFYVIYLEDEKSYKEITVYDGEVSLLSDVSR